MLAARGWCFCYGRLNINAQGIRLPYTTAKINLKMNRSSSLHDRIVDEEMDRFIINLQDSDSSSYTDSDDDSSDMDISDE